MISLSQIEQDLTAAVKAKDQIAVDTLRGLKNRIHNEQIARHPAKDSSASGEKDLGEAEITALVRSELKRRKEAVAAYKNGGREELAQKELQEAAILEKYMPAQMSEADLLAFIDKTIVANNFSAADFGKAMGMLKDKVGDKADGATLARLLKEKLK